jgi:hypothetical protein
MVDYTGNDTRADGADLLDFIAAQGLERPHSLGTAAELLAQALAGGVQAAISAPPRHGKTTLAVHAAAMALETRQRSRIGYFTNSSPRARDTATRIAGATRGGLQPDRECRLWRSGDGGALVVGTVGGAIGLRAIDLLVVDEPVKNAAEAADAERLQAQWQWLQAAKASVASWGSVVLLGSRWSWADMIGRAVREGSWDHLNYAALDAQGEALLPRLWSAEVLGQIRECVGEPIWSALYLGKPFDRPRVPRAAPAVSLGEL